MSTARTADEATGAHPSGVAVTASPSAPGGKQDTPVVQDVHSPIYLRTCTNPGARSPETPPMLVRLAGQSHLRFCTRIGARAAAMTLDRCSRLTPSLSSASLVPIPAISSSASRSDVGGISASATAISSSWSIGCRPALRLGMHGPRSVARYGFTASLSCLPQNDRHRTCLPGASYSRARHAPQSSTGHGARHWPFRSRRPPRAGLQWSAAQSSASGNPSPQAIGLPCFLYGKEGRAGHLLGRRAGSAAYGAG